MAALPKIECTQCGRKYSDDVKRFPACPKCRTEHPKITARKERERKAHIEAENTARFGPRVRCPNCGHEGRAETYTKGSFGIEVVLWLLFLIPGLIYSIWRLCSRYKGCSQCRWEHVAPIHKAKEKYPL